MNFASRNPDQPTVETHALHPDVAALLDRLTAIAPTAAPANSATIADGHRSPYRAIGIHPVRGSPSDALTDRCARRPSERSGCGS
jgi:hypothetical protein